VSDPTTTLAINKSRTGEHPMVTKTVTAYELQPGWIVLPTSRQPRRIALARCVGAHPHVIVHWVGGTERTVYDATDPITIEDNQ